MPSQASTPDYDYTPLKSVTHWWVIAAIAGGVAITSVAMAVFHLSAEILFFVCAISASFYLWYLNKMHFRAVEKFAILNGLPAGEAVIPPAFSGLGHDERTTNAYLLQTADSDIPCVVFDYSYVTGSGKSQQTHRLSVAYMQNTKAYPHLFLDGMQNGASYTYQSQQKIALEGDFNDYFNLYIPEGQQIDALSIITPDVMQTLVDGGRPYDIEIIDDVVFIIAKGSSYSPEKLPALLGFGANLMREFDERNISWQPLSLPTESWQVDTLRRSKIRSYAILAVAVAGVFAYFLVSALAVN